MANAGQYRTIDSDAAITIKHLFEFSKHEGSEHPVVDRSIAYFKDIQEAIAKEVQRDPENARKLARDALECLLLGMREAFRKSYCWPDRSSFMSRIYRRLFPVEVGAVDGFHPRACQMYLLLMFDAAHNLPSIQDGAFKHDVAYEIASTLALLKMHPKGRIAVEMLFDRFLDKRL